MSSSSGGNSAPGVSGYLSSPGGSDSSPQTGGRSSVATANGGSTALVGSATSAGQHASGGLYSAGGSRTSTGGTTLLEATTGGVKASGGISATARTKALGGKPAGGTGTTLAIGGAGGNAGTPNVVVDRARQLQTIDGFGFFGAQDTWWGSASDMWSDEWGTLVVEDLGITIWRNEYYSEESGQDANWAKQLPVVKGLKRIADANRVPLKFVYTVWSAPSNMKCTVASVQSGQATCSKHPDGLKNGGTLDPAKYEAYAQWLVQGIKNYADAGVTIHAVSPQNEPMFVEPYNSCVYDVDPTERNSYSRMLNAVAPVIKANYPEVRIFGTENMLELEGQQWFYSAAFDDATFANLDIFAYHGYQDGVAPTGSSQLATYWKYVNTNWAEPHGKPSWMTETSGYTDGWDDENGARTLGFAIYSALKYGQISAWIWWQGSELGGAPGQYTLMGGTKYLGKRYYVSKQFYRFIRPGARMVQVTSTDSDLFVVAFSHSTMNAFTIVAINAASRDKKLMLGGAEVPVSYTAYRTSAQEDCKDLGAVANGDIVLKADSITTLVNGKVYE